MPIVSDKNVSDALTYMCDDPHPIALAQKDLTDAENELKRVYASVYLEQSGPVRDKEMACEVDPRVGRARAAVADAEHAFNRHRERRGGAVWLCEVWRSENANIRAAERVR